MSETNTPLSATTEQLNTETPTTETKLQKFEREQLTRRQALRKFGFGAGMAALALLSTDDLAHMVGKRMAQIAGDNKIANTVAKELENAGVARADIYVPPAGCGSYGIKLYCQCCTSMYHECMASPFGAMFGNCPGVYNDCNSSNQNPGGVNSCPAIATVGII